MFIFLKCIFLYSLTVADKYLPCAAEIDPFTGARAAPELAITSAHDPDYHDVIVKRVDETLNLTCTVLGAEDLPHTERPTTAWNFQPGGSPSVSRPHLASVSLPSGDSRLSVGRLSVNDTGRYICLAPPLSVSKYIVVQKRGPVACARGAFSCRQVCVLPLYVCDGRQDCAAGEDESPLVCGTGDPCRDKLNCSDGRCVAREACCDRTSHAHCARPACCDEHLPAQDSSILELCDLVEDSRHLGDDYGFIQTTIYTVTACALIFMIAVVLLVSAICKMHMKRAAWRSYARAELQHYNMQCAQGRFPPCYEASRLLGPEPLPGAQSPHTSPQHQMSAAPVAEAEESADSTEAEGGATPARPTHLGLGRLGAALSARYRAPPAPGPDVELADVRASTPPSCPPSPLHRYRSPTFCDPSPLHRYRSPTFCDLDGGDFYFADADAARYGRELNYMTAPFDLFVSERERQRRANAVERILDRITFNRADSRPLTLNLGRFQLSIPRLSRPRADAAGRRPDTPNVAELNIDELDFVRLNSNETYTLNGRTIRLLGANFENYPSVLGNANSFVGRMIAPPPYSEVVSAAPSKVFGPPPAYLSRENLTTEVRNDNNNGEEVSLDTMESRTVPGADCNGNVSEEETRSTTNVEPPPGYEELVAPERDSNHNCAE